MPSQISISCGADFSCTIALDLQHKLKPFLQSSLEQMAVHSFLEFIALSCSSEVLFVKFPGFQAFFVDFCLDIYIFMDDRIAALRNIV